MLCAFNKWRDLRQKSHFVLSDKTLIEVDTLVEIAWIPEVPEIFGKPETFIMIF